MTVEQQHYITKIEFAIASLVRDGEKKLARALDRVHHWLDNEEVEIAVLEAECMGFREEDLNYMRKLFDVRW